MNFLSINDLDTSKRMPTVLSRAKYATSYVVFRKFCIMTWNINCKDKGKLVLSFNHTLLSGRSKVFFSFLEM